MNSKDFNSDVLEKILSRLDSIEDRITALELNNEKVKQLQTVSNDEEDDDSGFSDLKISISTPLE